MTAGRGREGETDMNEITIRNLDDQLLRRLKQWAWQRGLPLEDSLRLLLVEATRKPARVQAWEHYDKK